MVELLSVLALASKQIKQGRFSECAITKHCPSLNVPQRSSQKSIGESEIEAVLQRLDRLTREETQMTLAQTLGVVHGLVGNMKVVMEGAQWSHDHLQTFI